MKTVENIDDKEMVVSYEGWDYTFPPRKPVFVNEALYDFVKDGWPLTFATTKVEKGKVIPTVEKRKTKNFFPTQAYRSSNDMIITPSNAQTVPANPDGLPQAGGVDKDGVEWVGDGIEEEKI
jgi:hypothetical protein